MSSEFQRVTRPWLSGTDFQRRVQYTPSQFALIAPHGGGIEPGTAKLVEGIAGKLHSFYIFEGIMVDGNKELHVPSTEFDDPLCLDLLDKTRLAITIHGCKESRPVTYVGGLHNTYREKIIYSLHHHGFTAVTDHSNHAGIHPDNLCNRGHAGRGVQIEVSYGLRQTFFREMTRSGREHPTEHFHLFVLAIRNILK